MFRFNKFSSLAGAGYVILNVIRVMNIISLLAVMTASGVMLVKIIMVNRFYFFDACGHVIEIIISGFLIVSELPFFKSYFTKKWPLVSQKSGFVMLGCAMLVMGNGILANLNKDATSPHNIGLAFWRIVIASGIIVIVMGAVNIMASFIFRNTTIGLTARQVRSHGAVAQHKLNDDEESKPSPRTRTRSFFLGKRDSLPSYYAKSSLDGSVTQTPRSKTPRVNISSPINNDKDQFSRFDQASPVVVGVQPPNLARHPAMTHGGMI